MTISVPPGVDTCLKHILEKTTQIFDEEVSVINSFLQSSYKIANMTKIF